MLKKPRLNEIVVTRIGNIVLDIGFVDGVCPISIATRKLSYSRFFASSIIASTQHFGAPEYVNWQHTGIFTTLKEWNEKTLDASTEEVCKAYGISYMSQKIEDTRCESNHGSVLSKPEEPSLDRKLATMLFCQYFEVSHLMSELMERVDADTLLDFISGKFQEEYSIEEFLQFSEEHSACELGCLSDEEKIAVTAALFQIDYDDAKEQLEEDMTEALERL